MKKIMSTLLLGLLLILAACQSKENEPIVISCDPGYELIDDECIKIIEKPIMKNEYVTYNDELRNYLIYLPIGIKVDAPLVFVLHGISGTALNISKYAGMNEIADINQFAVVYPQGSNYNGLPLWNAELDGPTVDDVGFLDYLASYIQDKYNLSKENTFISGHSNGGFMSYTMACKSSETFGAYASYAGLMSNITWNTCTPSAKINLLHIHGTNDLVVPNDGTMNIFGGFGGAPEILTMLSFWTDYNKADILTETNLNATSHIYQYTSTVNANIIKYIELEGQSHSWPNDNQIIADDDNLNDTSQEIWRFFSQFIK